MHAQGRRAEQPAHRERATAGLQRVDLGHAMSHFELVAREQGLEGWWLVRAPGPPLPGRDVEYVATWCAAAAARLR
jgi:hypothetical protein